MEPCASEVTVDTLGNLVCKVKPLSPPEGAEPKRIMVAAPMDEIGVMVSYVDDKGFIRFSTVGGLNPYVLMGQKVVFANGTVGVFGAERIEDIKDLKFDKMFIDISATSRERWPGVHWNVAAMKREFSDLDNRVTCRPWTTG